MRHAQPRLHNGGGGGKAFIRRGGGADDHVQLAGIDAGIDQRGAGGAKRKVRGLFAGLGDIALADAGALADPLIRGVHALGQIVIGDDIGWQAGADTDNARPDCRQTGHSSPARPPALSAAMVERSAAIRALMSALAIAMAISSALANPPASALPWFFTTMPFSPRKTPPFWARGSILRFSAFSAP